MRIAEQLIQQPMDASVLEGNLSPSEGLRTKWIHVAQTQQLQRLGDMSQTHPAGTPPLQYGSFSRTHKLIYTSAEGVWVLVLQDL